MKCLKRINYGTQKLLFVYGAKEHLINNGFPYVDKYSVNVDGNPYALVNEDIYTLSEWINGRECDFKNKEDIINASKCLANMHIASKGYEPPENSKLKTDLGRWHHLMEKRVKALDKMNDMGRKKSNKESFDLNYMKAVKFYKDLGRKAIEVLNDSQYDELCDLTKDEKGFCHHDFANHNILISSNGQINIIDFDYCILDSYLHDVGSLLIRKMKGGNWSINNALFVLDAYNVSNRIKQKHIPILAAFIEFPQDYWQIGIQYYWEKQPWSEETFIKKLKKIYDDDENKQDFVRKFSSIKYN
jgi:spore coat-associated protein S